MSRCAGMLKVGMAGCLSLMLVCGLVWSPALAASNVTTLSVVYYYTSETEKDFIQKILDEYQQQHPNIKLDVQVTTQAKWPEIMTTRAIAKQLPDVAMSVPQRVGVWAAGGLLQDGREYIPKGVVEKFDQVRLLSDIYKGQIVGFPVSSTVRAIAYNVDYFSKAGITPPRKADEAWTWNQLVDVAKKVKAASGARYALQFEKPSFDGWLPFLYQAGGQVLNEDGTKAAINSPQTRRALEWTAMLHKEGVAAPGIIEGTEDPLRTFVSGMSTMWLATGNWMMPAIEPQMKFKWSFTFLPKDVGQATVVGGGDGIVFKGNHPRESWDLVLTLVGPKYMGMWNTLLTSIPPRTDVQAQYAIKPELGPFFAEQARMMPKNLQLHQLTPTYAASRDKLLQELSACVSGQQSADQTLAAMEKVVTENLKK